VLVRRQQGLVEDGEPLAGLSSLTVQGGNHVEPVVVGEGEKAALLALPHELVHGGARAPVGGERLSRRPVLHELESEEDPEPPHLADRAVPAASSVRPGRSTASPMRAAFSTMCSSVIALIVATAARAGERWPE